MNDHPHTCPRCDAERTARRVAEAEVARLREEVAHLNQLLSFAHETLTEYEIAAELPQ